MSHLSIIKTYHIFYQQDGTTLPPPHPTAKVVKVTNFPEIRTFNVVVRVGNPVTVGDPYLEISLVSQLITIVFVILDPLPRLKNIFYLKKEERKSIFV